MKVIILKTSNNKSIIGFSTNPVEFAAKWLSNRSQYTDITPTTNGAKFKLSESDDCTIYGSELIDGETCYISCNGNLMGFNDNH